MSSQAEAPAQVGGVSLDGFDTVGCHFEPGDFRYPFPWMQSSREELQSLLPARSMGGSCPGGGAPIRAFLCFDRQSEEYTLYVFPYPEKEKTILKLEPIDPPDDGSGSVSFFAPAQVGRDAKEFMQPFEEQASAQRGDAKELMWPFEE